MLHFVEVLAPLRKIWLISSKKNLVTLIVTSLTGEESGALFCRPPFLQYLNGALDKPDVVIEKKERAKKAKVRI
jgi:hypothetical protein